MVNDPRGVKEVALQYGDSFLALKPSVRYRATMTGTRDDRTSRLNEVMARPGSYAHVIADYDDDELRAALDVATGRRHGLDSYVIENFKEVQVHLHVGGQVLKTQLSYFQNCRKKGAIERIRSHSISSDLIRSHQISVDLSQKLSYAEDEQNSVSQ